MKFRDEMRAAASPVQRAELDALPPVRVNIGDLIDEGLKLCS